LVEFPSRPLGGFFLKIQTAAISKNNFMKTKIVIAASTCLVLILSSLVGRAMDITALSSGNWSDTNIWSSATVPGINDDIDVPAGINVTVDTNEVIQFIYDGGTVTMGPNASLNVFLDQAIASTITLDTTAPGNTVIYSCNPYFARSGNYYNLILANTNWPGPANQFVEPWEDFNNFSSGGASAPTPITVHGNMTLMGAIKVQEANVAGVPITIMGNLTIGSGCAWDCSSGNLTVVSNLYLNGFLEDLDGAHGTNSIGGSVIVSGPSVPGKNWSGGTYTNGWYLGDVTTWGIGGNLTNNGVVFGVGYGSIFFNGVGSIAGSNTLTIPTMTIDGNYAIDNTIILTTNNADFSGTLTFDLANTNQIVLRSLPAGPNNQTNYYSGNLIVVNSGPAPTSGKSYQLFNAAHYAGTFASETLTGLPGGLSWVDNLATSGSIAVAGSSGGGSPIITATRNGNVLTLSWDSTTFPGYSVQAQTNKSGLGTHWAPAGSGTTSPFIVNINPANSSVFYRLSNP
jgi:hypothetical protein